MLSLIAVFALSAGYLPWWLVRGLCLWELVFPTFGRDGHPGYAAAEPSLPSPALTPPDDRCFYYCFVCLEKPATYLSLQQNQDTGFFGAATDAVMMKDQAVALRVRIVARLRSLGYREQADRLL